MKSARELAKRSAFEKICLSALVLAALGACHVRGKTTPDGGSGQVSPADAAAPDDSAAQADASDATDPPDATGADAAAGDGFSTIELSVGELVFDARVAGPPAGELVLLLHGFPQTSYQWRHSLQRLSAAGYRAVAPDQRGYSPRARPTSDSDYAMRSLVLDVLGMADALGAQRFHVVGHDWGAVVAWVLAAVVKDRVLSVTAVSTAHPDLVAQHRAMPDSCQTRATSHFAERKKAEAAAELLANDAQLLKEEYGDLPTDAVDEYLRVLGTQPALDAALSWYRANIDQAQAPAPIGPVQVPTLYVYSDEDPTNCKDVALANEAFVTGPYRLQVFEGLDHWVVERAADAFNDRLIEHLQGSSARD
jgi:pimeloyl-ACP methyl ester carboxylesterase